MSCLRGVLSRFPSAICTVLTLAIGSLSATTGTASVVLLGGPSNPVLIDYRKALDSAMDWRVTPVTEDSLINDLVAINETPRTFSASDEGSLDDATDESASDTSTDTPANPSMNTSTETATETPAEPPADTHDEGGYPYGENGADPADAENSTSNDSTTEDYGQYYKYKYGYLRGHYGDQPIDDASSSPQSDSGTTESGEPAPTSTDGAYSDVWEPTSMPEDAKTTTEAAGEATEEKDAPQPTEPTPAGETTESTPAGDSTGDGQTTPSDAGNADFSSDSTNYYRHYYHSRQVGGYYGENVDPQTSSEVDSQEHENYYNEYYQYKMRILRGQTEGAEEAPATEPTTTPATEPTNGSTPPAETSQPSEGTSTPATPAENTGSGYLPTPAMHYYGDENTTVSGEDKTGDSMGESAGGTSQQDAEETTEETEEESEGHDTGLIDPNPDQPTDSATPADGEPTDTSRLTPQTSVLSLVAGWTSRSAIGLGQSVVGLRNLLARVN